ncbi:MAG: hypothetical protein WAL29_03605, partial [Bacteroidales bacterium]
IVACSEGLAVICREKDRYSTNDYPQHRNPAMNRGGFSWKRLLGISQAKARISRKISIPLTRSGRQQKLGAMLGPVLVMMTVLKIFM